jgi:hypothetical protein
MPSTNVKKAPAPKKAATAKAAAAQLNATERAELEAFRRASSPAAPSHSETTAVVEKRTTQAPKVGAIIRRPEFDPYGPAGGVDVVRLGLVVGIEDVDAVDERTGKDVKRSGARVVWLDTITDPIGVDELEVVS